MGCSSKVMGLEKVSPSLMSLNKASGFMPRARSSSASPTRPPDGTGKPSRRGAWADSARVASKTQVGSRHRIRPSPRSTGRTCRCSAKPPRLGSSTNSRARRSPGPLVTATAQVVASHLLPRLVALPNLHLDVLERHVAGGAHLGGVVLVDEHRRVRLTNQTLDPFHGD